MHYTIEAILVGIYTCIVFAFISLFTKANNIIFFITGFAKHFIGYYSGLHKLYCKRRRFKKKIYVVCTESIFEGIAFFICGLFLSKVNLYVSMFLIGSIFHISAEWIGLHRYFCKGYANSASSSLLLLYSSRSNLP
jgi:hypothetical protein